MHPVHHALHLLLAAVALLPVPASAQVQAQVQTVCTVTVNSPDEKDSFRRHLPEARYRFVELVERGRPDWLRSACNAAVSCDVLVISGHYDGGHEFFSDRLDAAEHLPVDELERVSCSASCPSLFSRLKQVYLFGCNTLNPLPQSSASADIVRSLVREGHAPKAAGRLLQTLAADFGESSRERMRQVFKDVPVIYGFASTAPLGPIAGATLDRYLRAGGAAEVGQPRASSRLLSHFAPFGMTAAAGLTDGDPGADARREVCQFADDRTPDADKLALAHQLLQRPLVFARPHLDRLQRLATRAADPAQRTPELDRALADIRRDTDARDNLLGYARSKAPPELRVRLVQLAHDLGWLGAEQQWEELALMLGELQARPEVGVPEVNLACTLNRQHELEGAFNRRVVPGSAADDVPHAAMRACLGSAEGHARTLQGLLSPNEADVAAAQAYLRHRPLGDVAELRRLAQGIAAMPPSDAQVRALETLGRHYVSDTQVLGQLTQLYAQTPSAVVQAAIAGILMRADVQAIASPQLLQTLRERRRPVRAGDGSGMVDALIQRLAAMVPR
jgi:hypothetical protein